MDTLTLLLMTGLAAMVPLYAFVLSSNTFALILIFSFALTPGLFELALGIPSSIPRAAAELCIVMLFTKAIFLKMKNGDKGFRVIGFLPMFGVFAVSFISFLINELSIDNYLAFLRFVFLYYLFFLALLNLNLSDSTVKTVNQFLMLAFGGQIVPALIKFARVGLQEGGGIGTVSVHAGEFSTTLPLFAIAFVAASYFYYGKAKYLLWVLVFIAFGILGAKRALVFYVPLLLGFMYLLFVYGRRSGRDALTVVDRRRMRKVGVAFAVVGMTVIYVGFRTMEALNPEQSFGGSFDPLFALETVIAYENNVVEEGGYFEKEQEEAHSGPDLATGRISATLISFKRLIHEGPLALALGSGAGLLAGSLSEQVNIFEALHSLGIRYGATGFVWFINQVGIVGAVLFLLLYGGLFRKGWIAYRTIPDVAWKCIALGFLGASFVFLLDFLTYSLSTLTMGVLAPVYYYIAAICFKRLHKEFDTKDEIRIALGPIGERA